MNKISKKHILVIALLVVLGAGLVVGVIAGLNAVQTKMDAARISLLARTDPETALDELLDSNVKDDGLSAYLSVLTLTKQAMNADGDAAAMDKLSQLISSSQMAIAMEVMSPEQTAAVEKLLDAAKGGDTCTAQPYAALQQLLEYSASLTGYSYRLKMGLEFYPTVLEENLTALTDSYNVLYGQLEGELGEYADEAGQLGEDCDALVALLTGELGALNPDETFRFQYVTAEWDELDTAAHVNHDALQLVLAERVLPVFRACVEEMGLSFAE